MAAAGPNSCASAYLRPAAAVKEHLDLVAFDDLAYERHVDLGAKTPP